MCLPIQFINSKGIYHRDLKPANFLILSKNNHFYLMLNDFGIARNLNATRPQILTEAGLFSGTYFFNSPERIKSEEGSA
jgi:eukaryotic-like serine/threonine-protein kinase